MPDAVAVHGSALLSDLRQPTLAAHPAAMQVPPQGPQPVPATTPGDEHPQAAAGAAGANLQALCSDTVFDSLSQQQLDEMPSHVLAQLLRDCAVQRKELKRELADAKQQAQEFSEWKERRYIVDPPKYDVRVDQAMQDRADAVTSKWRPRLQTDPENDSGPLWMGRDKPEIVYDSKLQTFKLLSAAENCAQRPDISVCLPWVLADVISSPLLLYRLRCLFPVEVQGGDRYKCVWLVEVVHKASGRYLLFREHKGAAWVPLSADDPNQQFVQDSIELLNLLCDPRCPHTYDGTVAGCMA